MLLTPSMNEPAERVRPPPIEIFPLDSDRNAPGTRFTRLKMSRLGSGSSWICSVLTVEPTEPEVVWICSCCALTSTVSVTAPISSANDCVISDATFRRSPLTSTVLNPSAEAAMLYSPGGMLGTANAPLMPVSDAVSTPVSAFTI